MFEEDEENKRWNAVHHPFTAPKDGHEDLMSTDPACVAKAYDMVLNGWERRRLGAYPPRRGAGQSLRGAQHHAEEEQRIKFGFPLDALQYGAPRTVAWPLAWTASSR